MKRNDCPKLIHVGEYIAPGFGLRRLYLRLEDTGHFRWYEEIENEEIPTDIEGATLAQAMRLAHKTWKHNAFRTLICGFRYTLPERDEHGMNALFHQMAASQNSFNGVYFDEDLGHNCFVQNASIEALNLLKQLENSNRL